MELPDGITKEDFLHYCGTDVINQGDKKECSAYSSYFTTKATEAESKGDTKAFHVLRLLAVLTLHHLKLDTPEAPFGSLSLDDTYLELLSNVVTDVNDPELRARIADVLCLHQPHYRTASIAISAYLESAKRLEDPVHWVATADRMERALQLAAKWGKKSDRFSTVVNHIENVLATYNGEDPLFLSAKLMTLLLDVRAGDATQNAIRAEKAALRAEVDHEWRRAREYWSIKTQWHVRNQEGEQAREAQVQRAETYVKEAEDALSRIPPSYMHATAHIRSAIESLRRIANTKERVRELHKVLLNYQQKSMLEMIPISSSADISELVKAAEDQVKGKPLLDALTSLASLGNSPKVSHLRSRAQEQNERYLLRKILPNVYHNALGRVVANQPKDAEEALQADMFQIASYYRSLHVQGVIEPARYQILEEHYVRIEDLLPFVSDNPFIRPGREYIIARGLHAGLHGDFLTAVHLLIPQLEDSVRYLLLRLGIITSALDDKGIQDEHNLNEMLSASEYTKPLTNFLGEDFVFDMRGLLIARFGANLRNEMAHGLINHDAFYSSSGCYLWWLTLRLYSWPVVAKLQEDQEEQS